MRLYPRNAENVNVKQKPRNEEIKLLKKKSNLPSEVVSPHLVTLGDFTGFNINTIGSLWCTISAVLIAHLKTHIAK